MSQDLSTITLYTDLTLAAGLYLPVVRKSDRQPTVPRIYI